MVPAGVLWDTGLSENILVQESFKPDFEAFSYLISAAYIEGNRALTANIAQQFLESYPHAAWQAYIALGMLAFQAGVNAGEADQPTEVQNNMDWPHGDIEQGYKELDNADYWFTEAYRLFPTRFEVCDAFIKWQALSGNIALIPEPADPIQSGEKIDRIRFFSDIHGESSQRVSALAVELAAKYPNSPEVINLVLFTLFKERSWDNFLQLLTQSKSKYSIGTTNVFYDIVARVCSGNTDSAIDGILKENSSDSYAYIYNLGLLEISLKHFGKAFDVMKAAASKAPSIKRKAETLIHVSHIAKTLGKPELWESYQSAAVSLDPDCLLIPENSALLYGE